MSRFNCNSGLTEKISETLNLHLVSSHALLKQQRLIGVNQRFPALTTKRTYSGRRLEILIVYTVTADAHLWLFFHCAAFLAANSLTASCFIRSSPPGPAYLHSLTKSSSSETRAFSRSFSACTPAVASTIRCASLCTLTLNASVSSWHVCFNRSISASFSLIRSRRPVTIARYSARSSSGKKMLIRFISSSVSALMVSPSRLYPFASTELDRKS